MVGYGLTETSPSTLMVRVKDGPARRKTAGLLLPGLEARIVTAEREDGEAVADAAPGEPGELWIRGDSIMKVQSPARAIPSRPLNVVVMITGLPEQPRGNKSHDHAEWVVQDGRYCNN